VLAVGAFVGDGDDVVGVTTDAAAGAETVRAAALGFPSGVRELLSETTTTLVEATGATTSTTEVPATTVAPSSTSTTEAAEDEDPTTTTTPAAATPGALTAGSSTTTAAPTTTQAPRRETTTTRAAPQSAPSTTSAPTTTAPTTTTTAPPSSSDSSGGYAYDDPRSTQVWYDLAQCESGGDWSINTGNGYYGGLQFSLATWESVGGSGYPHEHPAGTQIDYGRKLHARQGWGAWPHCSKELGLR
jgi:hypothetical protein